MKRVRIDLLLLPVLLGCLSYVPVEADGPVVLEPGEGLLVVETETRFDSWLGIGPRWLGSTMWYDLRPGRRVDVIRVQQGAYRWAKLEMGQFLRWRTRSLREFEFDVEPGKLNYPGSVYADPSNGEFRVSNRSGEVVVALQSRFPQLLARYPIRFSGNPRDDFLSVYSAALHGEGAASRPEAEWFGNRRISSAATCGGRFFRPFEIQQAVMSPDGKYVAVEIRVGGDPRVRVLEADGELETEILTVDRRPDVNVTQLAWGDGDTVVFTIDKLREARRGLREDKESITYVVDILRDGSRLLHRNYLIEQRGVVVDPIPQREDEILYQPADDPYSVYRVRLSELTQYRMERRTDGSTQTQQRDVDRFPDSARVAHLREPAGWWLTDPSGHVRGAWTFPPDGGARLWFRSTPEGRWKKVLSYGPGDDPSIVPVGFTADGQRMLAVSDRDRDTYALYDFDPGRRELGSLVYAHPSAQVVNVVYDFAARRPIAAVYHDQGVPRWHYFDTRDREERAALEQRFPGQTVYPISSSADGRKLVVLATGASDPGGFHWVDLDGQRVVEIGARAPWLDPGQLARVTPYRVKGEDGLEIDAFLALPMGVSRPPLVVLPHGGPVGVMDDRTFSREVQYLAEAGLAILQVNYRGSEGYGKSFMQAGHRQWGKGIEDDIDAAVDHVLALGLVDGDRICIAGGSYGGFSALVSASQHRRRLRCAASFAGVTDIPLLFEQSDWSWSRTARRRAIEVIGDPESDYEGLRDLSPVYQVAELSTPVFIAQGTDDVRVDRDHAYRMRAMLEAHGKAFDWWMAEGVGHGFETPDQECAYLEKLRSFLVRHLEPDAP